VAGNISYVAAEQLVRLRGGEPTVWDSRARTKAIEIDSDLSKHISYGRGKTYTTYYSQEQTNGATPFNNVKSPVYVTAERFEFQHDSGVAIYTGNARLWQEDNFVRGDKVSIYRDSKRMDASGHVQSALYQARRKAPNGGNSVVPVFATAEKMWYSDPERLIHYETNVDIKQGTDRLTGGTADVYLQKDKGEVERTVAERDVVLTQPGRRGTGTWAQYTAADDSVILKGSPARVEDAQQGNTESGRLTVYLGESRVVADDSRGSQSAGRVHSTHRVKKQD
jgi:lipopolysaccharide export system protein LptA